MTVTFYELSLRLDKFCNICLM